MSSSAPHQPPTAAAYAQSNNPVSRNPAESSTSSSTSNTNTNTNTDTDQTTEAHRTASSAPSTGVPTSLARGVHGTAAEAGADKGASEVGGGQDDAEKMAAPGEGAVADAVVNGQGKSGAAGAGGLGTEEDLGRKKAEQAPLREAVKQERKHDVDVGGVLGQRGGPANPVP